MTDSQKAKIIRLRADGKGYRAISHELGISLGTVKSYCIRNGIDAEKATKLAEKITAGTTQCENCGKAIKQDPQRKHKRFCSDGCRNQWWNKHLSLVKRKAYYHFKCAYCGKEFELYGDRRRTYCSHECYIAARFKGGERHD